MKISEVLLRPRRGRRVLESCPLLESGPQGQKGKLQAVALVKDERRIEYTDGSDFQRATWLMRGVAPSVACATASPEGTPRIRC